MTVVSKTGAAIAVAFLLTAAGGASAAVLGPLTNDGGEGGNVCPAGDFDDCVLNVDLDGDGQLDPTPAIIKFDLAHILSAATDFDEINSEFPVDGTEFVFSNFVYKDGSELVKFDFAYTLGAGDPALTAVAVKASATHTVSTDFTFNAGVYSGTLFGVGCSESVLSGGECKEVSNVVFFDTGTPDGVIPLPASAFLLLGGLGGLGALRSYRRKA